MEQVNRILHKILSWLTITIFTLLIFDVVLGVVSRYVFGGQIRWTEGLATFLLVWLVFCGSAIAYYEKAHLGIDLLVANLTVGAQKFVNILTQIILIAFVVVVMINGGIDLVLERWESGQVMPTLGILKAWMYLTIPVNGLFIIMFAIEQLMHTVKTKHNIEEEAVS